VLAALALLLALSDPEVRPAVVVVDGIEVQDSFTLHVFTRLNSIETTLGTNGETLAAIRSSFTTVQRDEIDRTAEAGKDALAVARTLLNGYIETFRAPAITHERAKAREAKLKDQRATIEKQIRVLALVLTQQVTQKRGEQP